MERLAPKPLDRIAVAAAPSQRVEGNTLHRSALLGGRYGSEILATRNLGTHLRTGLGEASHKDNPLPDEQQSGGSGFGVAGVADPGD